MAERAKWRGKRGEKGREHGKKRGNGGGGEFTKKESSTRTVDSPHCCLKNSFVHV